MTLNSYKVQIARTAVKRAIMKAAGLNIRRLALQVVP